MREVFKTAGWMLLLASITGLPIVARGQTTVTIVNTADATFAQAPAAPSPPGEAQVISTRSNAVTALVSIPAPTLRIFNDPNYTNEPRSVDTGDDLYLQATAPGCIHDLGVRETIKITLTSLTSGDQETMTAVETAPASGVFDSAQAINTMTVTTAPTWENQWLELWGEDEIDAKIEGCGGVAFDSILVDPDGIVFDSQTNSPIAGAVVRLIDVTGNGNGGHPGGDAVVYDFDQATVLAPSITTGANGRFQFPFVPESDYKLVVDPPGDYSFPSVVAPEDLNPARTIHLAGSYGNTFSVNAQTGPVTLDVPLDPKPDGLVIQKSASTATAEIAESVGFTIDMQNISGVALDGMVLHDRLPPGFTFIAGSAKFDGAPLADPAGGKGPALEFKLPAFGPTQQSKLTYRVAIGPGALEGDGTNRATLTSATPARKHSNLASVKVNVQGGVFDDRAYVLGKVFGDCNENGLQDAGEPGLPGVRLYMEDGSYVITDGEGKYSFYGVIPRTHVLKADATSLPDGTTLAPVHHRNAGRGDSLFLDVQRGELHRADFATKGCTPQLNAQVATLRKNVAGSRELDGVKTALRNETTPVGDVRGLPASGVIGQNTALNPGIASTSMTRLAANGADSIAAAVGHTDLKALMPQLDAWLGFVDLYEGAEVSTTELTVRVKGTTKSDIRLTVNDVEVGADHIGLKLEDPTRTLQALEYVGVSLQPGMNTLGLAQKDDNGHFREVVAIHVVAPGVIARVKITPPQEGIPADGEHVGLVRVAAIDADGVKVTSRTPVTLETTAGEWMTADLDPSLPGVQVFVEGGEVSFGLRSFKQGTATVRATTTGFDDTAEVSFVSALRPMIAVGVIEGTFNLEHFDAHELTAARHDDGFEQELVNFGKGKESNGGARAAVFLKGKIRGDYLLTMGFDSDKDTKQALFRDIEPDRFYPVYGDSSIKGYDAQTSGRLYVRVERNMSAFTGGDITTQGLSQARVLGAYNRSLTGIKEHLEGERGAVDVFASHDSTRQVVDEFRANGTSGPYSLSNNSAIQNSELVEILTRNRDQPSIVMASVIKRRYVDYDIEPFTGRLLFRAPIPSLTADLDPISIRVTYEAEQGGDAFWTAGIDSKLKLGEHVEVGASYVDDQNPQSERKIGGVASTLRFGKETTIIAEAARTESATSDGDLGARVEYRHDGQKLQLRAYGSHTDEHFDNPSAGYQPNRTEAGAKLGYSITESTRWVGELLHSADDGTGAKRDGGLLGLEHSFPGNIKGELGVRHVIDEPSSQIPNATQTDTTSVRGKVTAPLPFARDVSVFGEYEQDIDNADAREAAVGGEYRLANRSRIYARHELISSLAGPYSLDPAQRNNTTVFGIDSTYWHDDAIFSEYRVGDSLSGRDAQAAIGLRNNWNLAEGLRLNTSFERTESLAGTPTTAGQDSTALTGAIEYTRNPLWKGTARIELRQADTSDSILATFGVARKLNSDWTLLARTVTSYIDNDVGEDRHQDRLQAGVAYRDSDNRVNALARYEFKREQGLEANLDRLVHVLSMHADLQQTLRLAFRGELATKLVEETVDGAQHDDGATLIAGRVTYDLAKRWDVGFNVRGLFNKEFDGVQGGIGAEIGFLVSDNLWLSTGYNIRGFRDDDLAEDEYTTRGVYLRLRFKFDETVLK